MVVEAIPSDKMPLAKLMQWKPFSYQREEEKMSSDWTQFFVGAKLGEIAAEKTSTAVHEAFATQRQRREVVDLKNNVASRDYEIAELESAINSRNDAIDSLEEKLALSQSHVEKLRSDLRAERERAIVNAQMLYVSECLMIELAKATHPTDAFKNLECLLPDQRENFIWECLQRFRRNDMAASYWFDYQFSWLDKLSGKEVVAKNGYRGIKPARLLGFGSGNCAGAEED